jgi:putative nucleotidyltransferase with HDIG domain
MADLSSYVGRWVALVRDQVAGSGGSAEEAQHAAKHNRPKEEPWLLFVSPQVQIFRAVQEHPLILTVFDLAHTFGISIYLVGGSVRDLLLGVKTRDLDFAVDGDGLAVARRIADMLGGAYVPLDRARKTGRVVRVGSAQDEPGVRHLDFAALRGDDLDADLHDRDFTINAMALSSQDGQYLLVDPLGGSDDLLARVLRATSPESFVRDPVRTLRAVRMHVQFGCEIASLTRAQLRAAVPLLHTISAERLRDEWFRILQQPNAADAILELQDLDLLQAIAPPLAALDGLEQSAPHRCDALTHAIETVRAIDQLWAAFQGRPTDAPLLIGDEWCDLVPAIVERYESSICDERTYLALLRCAALLHDIGKPETRVTEGDKIRFIGHERTGARLAGQLARSWRCSNAEVEMLSVVVKAHMRPTWLARQPTLTRRAVYRYFRDTGAYGVDAAFVALADYMATWGPEVSDTEGRRQVETVVGLWQAYLVHQETAVAPPPLLNGNDLIALGVPPGPRIGSLLARLREAQAAGEVTDRQEALTHVATWLECEE